MVSLDEDTTQPRRGLSRFDPGELRVGGKQILDYRVGCARNGIWSGLSVLGIRGIPSGPVLLATSGVHGDEYEGPVTLQELFSELDPDRLCGTLILIPVLNQPAMESGKRCAPQDGQDLARVFPGVRGGSLTEQLAHDFGQFVLPHADYYVDLHSAGSQHRMVFLSGYGVVSDSELLNQQRKMAIAFGGELVWGTHLLQGRTLTKAQDLKIPSIYTEITGTGGAQRQDIERYKHGMYNVMRLLGMQDGPCPTRPVRHFREAIDNSEQEGHLQTDHPAPCGGLFLPSVDLWDRVSRGEEIGRVVDAAGRVRTAVDSRRDGRIIMIRHQPSVQRGDPLAVVVANLSKQALR